MQYFLKYINFYGHRSVDTLIKCSPFFVLALQNLIIFFNHYFVGHGFPWDFPMSYYAMTVFWTTSVDSGIFPHWVPFQSMGYPLGMNLQTGIYYPPLWIFPTFHIPYTLTNAVRLQCLHVLFGSLGMFLFVKFIFKSSSYGLISAIAFQFFGGFYSNAQHVDIIRAYSLTPWLLYSSSFKNFANIDSFRIQPRNLLLPPLTYLMATGGYPGNFISSVFIIEIYIVLQSIYEPLSKIIESPKAYLKKIVYPIVTLSILLFLGITMASIHLGPAWILKDELVRSTSIDTTSKMGLWIEHIPGLFLSNRRLPSEISMTSSYVTLPVFIMLFFMPIYKLKQYWVFLVILLLNCLMIAGDNSFIWRYISKIISPLSLSRFPASDYRAYISIMIITLSILGIKAVVNHKISRESIFGRSLILCLIVGFGMKSGLYTEYKDLWLSDVSLQMNATNLQSISAAIVTFVMLLIIFLIYNLKIKEKIVASLIVSMIMFHGITTIIDMSGCWSFPNLESYYSSLPLIKNSELVTYNVFRNLPERRPEREILSMPQDIAKFPWKGYLNGSYMMEDYGGSVLQVRKEIEQNHKYKEFMQMKWQPLLMDVKLLEEFTDGKIKINNDVLFSASKYNKQMSVTQIHYGINTTLYDIHLDKKELMIENETYFPGWQAELINKQSGDKLILNASPVNNVFRGWLLPQGNYEMKATFELPYWTTFRNLSIVSLMSWLVFVFYSLFINSKQII